MGLGIWPKRVLLTFCASLLFLASGCSSSHAEPSDEAVENAYENAADDLSDANYEDVADTSQCTQDCSGHDAGFEWARNHDISDAADCGGDSQSFIEGCQAYVTTLDDQADDELSDDQDDQDG